MTLAQRCKRQRLRHFDTPAHAATRGLSAGAIRKIESGERPNPGIFTLLAMAERYGCTLRALVEAS